MVKLEKEIAVFLGLVTDNVLPVAALERFLLPGSVATDQQGAKKFLNLLT